VNAVVFALVGHVVISVLLIWRFASHTSYCTMPSEQVIKNARRLAELCRRDGLPMTYQDIIRFGVSTRDVWSPAPWTLIYAFVGFVIWVIIVVVRAAGGAS
jgi:hypothetical protein